MTDDKCPYCNKPRFPDPTDPKRCARCGGELHPLHRGKPLIWTKADDERLEREALGEQAFKRPRKPV